MMILTTLARGLMQRGSSPVVGEWAMYYTASTARTRDEPLWRVRQQQQHRDISGQGISSTSDDAGPPIGCRTGSKRSLMLYNLPCLQGR